MEERMLYRLEPKASANDVITIPEEGSRLRIGRLPSNDIVWTRHYVSRHHAELFIENNRAFLVPLTRDASLIRLNDRATTREARHELHAGDVIHFVQDKQLYAYHVRTRRALHANSTQPRTSRHTESHDVVDDTDTQTRDGQDDALLIEDDEDDNYSTQKPAKRTRQQVDAKSLPFLSGDDEFLECVICNGLLAFTHIAPCGHVACGSCLRTWLARKRQCPHCRQEVPPGAVLAPVHIVDRLVERHVQSVDAAEAEDWRRRCAEWRRSRPAGGAPLTAPHDDIYPARVAFPAPNLYVPSSRLSASPLSSWQRPRFGPRLIARSRGPTDIRSHFSSARHPASIRRPRNQADVIDLADDSDHIIDLAS